MIMCPSFLSFLVHVHERSTCDSSYVSVVPQYFEVVDLRKKYNYANFTQFTRSSCCHE